MTNYSTKPNSCRVDFFKPSIKWYTTEETYWDQYDGSIMLVFISSLKENFPHSYEGMTAGCLEPHHKYAHPVTVVHHGAIK